MAAPLLISLPTGLNVGGVTTFALRLANGLARRGRHATLLLHPEPRGAARVEFELDSRVEVLRPDVPSFESCAGDLSRFIPHYRDAIRRLHAQSGLPVVFAPQMHGDGFGIAAAISQVDPESIRVLGWQHSDIEHDARVLARFEPIVHKFIAVSDRIAATLRARLTGRAGDIVSIPCGVECEQTLSARKHDPGVLRLIYTGRIEHQQKRILALVYLSDELSRRGIGHRITAVGDGPASAEFDRAIGDRPIRRPGPISPKDIAGLLRAHDAFILPSRYEGLSVSMLEAMSVGTPPILARTDSGALQAIEPGYNGEIADVAPEADEREAAKALAEAVARFLKRDRAAMSDAAHQTVRDRFSLERHLDHVIPLVDSAAAMAARSWPAGRPCAFSSSGASGEVASGSVPADGAARLRALLESLAAPGRAVVIHGAGQHTLQLAAFFAESPARIVAVADDDRQRQGGKLWGWPIIAPEAAAAAGATDVVISSWMHQGAIWARRGVYESQRPPLRVHRIYELD